jgi:hypothetical protein
MFGRRAMMRDEFGKEADINTGQIFGFPFFASAAATADILTDGRKVDRSDGSESELAKAACASVRSLACR